VSFTHNFDMPASQPKVNQGQNLDDCCHIGVDLTLMIPGGGNGGIKPAILTFLRTLEDRFSGLVRFTFLTNSSTYHDVEFLVRKQDRMFCILLAHGCPWPSTDSAGAKLNPCPEFNKTKLREFEIDVLYCPFGPTNHSTSDIPTVSMVTDLLHRDYPFSIPESERIWREAYFKNILAEADYIQCISQYTLNRFLVHYRVNNDRVFFTHLPIDRRLEGATPVTPERPYFIYPANFWVHKNHEILLIAYRIYRRSTENPWELVLTGSPDERSEMIQNLAKLLRLEQHVQFVGHLDEPNFARTLEGAAALIYPSLHEGFGIPLLEAMRFRKPIICGMCTSVPEVVGDAAIFVDGKKPEELAAAMVRLTTNSALREDLVRKGEERLKMFKIETEIEKLYEVFRIAKLSNSKRAKFHRSLRRCIRANRLRLPIGRANKLAKAGAAATVKRWRQIRLWFRLRKLPFREIVDP
jgi:glycosyltransferase involved in cell wall biosynthesis